MEMAESLQVGHCPEHSMISIIIHRRGGLPPIHAQMDPVGALAFVEDMGQEIEAAVAALAAARVLAN